MQQRLQGGIAKQWALELKEQERGSLSEHQSELKERGELEAEAWGWDAAGAGLGDRADLEPRPTQVVGSPGGAGQPTPRGAAPATPGRYPGDAVVPSPATQLCPAAAGQQAPPAVGVRRMASKRPSSHGFPSLGSVGAAPRTTGPNRRMGACEAMARASVPAVPRGPAASESWCLTFLSEMVAGIDADRLHHLDFTRCLDGILMDLGLRVTN